MELDWKLMLYPPYSSNLAPSDYYLFRSLQNHVNGKNLAFDAAGNEWHQFFASKKQGFLERRIFEITERWQKVIQQNGCIT